jgi:hypothetical protein
MKKELKTLAVTLLLSLTAFSQTDTANLNKPITLSTDSVLCLPVDVARQVVVDLIKYDECIEVAAIQAEHILLLEQKINTQQAIIEEQQTQYEACREQIAVLNAQLNIYNESNKRLVDKNRKLKNANRILGATTTVAAAIITTLLLIK